MASKYERLTQRLREASGNRLRLSFSHIEAMLGFALPSSARALPPWWANDESGSHTQARAWLSVGWRTREVDIRTQQVTFERSASISNIRGSGVQERTGASLPAEIRIGTLQLTDAAARVLTDYLTETENDLALALSRSLEDAALTRRRRLINWFRENSPTVSGDSTDIIREERDAR